MRPQDDDVHLRARVDADASGCERLARAVHASDGYPISLRDDDFLGFVVSPAALAAWVIVRDAEIVGHVALHARTSRPAMALAAASIGVDESELGVVARLMVSPSARRRGIARRLLDIAVAEACRRDLVPILDVVTVYEPAVALYERAGWARLGSVSFSLPNGLTVEEFVYRAPR
jgi:GNAT superfamily N-acetyltransferase